MKTLLLCAAIAVALTGCATPAAIMPSTTNAPSPSPSPSPSPFHVEGTYWVKPSQGPEPARHEIPFTANASGMRVTATLKIGERYGPVELPTPTMGLTAELIDAAGASLAKAERMPGGETTLKLEGVATATGDGKLVLSTQGGSDEGQGGGTGDYVAYALDAS